MTDRETFLNYLAEKARRPRHQLADNPLVPVNDLPETTLSGKSQDELMEIARANSKAVNVNFQTTSKAGLPRALDDFIRAKISDRPDDEYQANGHNHLLLPTSDLYADFGLEGWRDGLHDPEPTFWKPGAGRDANIDTAEHAGAAIAFADYMLAESCSITTATTPGQGRAFHFLPVHYLAIVRKSCILPRSRQAMDRYDKAMKSGELKTSNINIITGPSNTGDIEMVLVVGVHGPLDMTYLVVEDM
ncbi:YkgG family protein [Bifidobacterium actinocoloniiforme DSM 22766]|uniref:YkgG family protein n=1 Tax=Bifidobacterium actinocoloniiforme DSM 22766 TaxID=1437605 RepID=A0A086Z259_9BIFI|nr:lactate utilization protein C [Bifidobacterium actinocoloniiforme]AKV55972.1 lactate utilization protein C [Bifidobacterium actinocoloniiforme DSM 22766]KFI40609.1 YkgG family protein [Bifidobacterium actinocoloniiforme DSM 22766]